MKQLMITVLIVIMLVTPCMAEVELAGIFSIEGTKWAVSEGAALNDIEMGFYQGGVYTVRKYINGCETHQLLSSNIIWYHEAGLVISISGCRMCPIPTTCLDVGLLSPLLGYGLIIHLCTPPLGFVSLLLPSIMCVTDRNFTPIPYDHCGCGDIGCLPHEKPTCLNVGESG